MDINVLIADDNQSIRESIVEYFKSKQGFFVVGDAGDGFETLNMLQKNKVDVLILDLIMPRLDGLSVLQSMKRMGSNTKVIVISELCQDEHINLASRYGADYYLIKPIDLNVLQERVLSLFMSHNQPINIQSVKKNVGQKVSIDEKVSNIFITVGIPAHIKGYQFLREAVKMAVDSPEVINCITKKIYPGVATRFSTSPSKVERAIRHAIEVAWSRGKIENINNIFGIKVYSANEKPTNGEFIALVADKILIESNCG